MHLTSRASKVKLLFSAYYLSFNDIDFPTVRLRLRDSVAQLRLYDTHASFAHGAIDHTIPYLHQPSQFSQDFLQEMFYANIYTKNTFYYAYRIITVCKLIHKNITYTN